MRFNGSLIPMAFSVKEHVHLEVISAITFSFYTLYPPPPESWGFNTGVQPSWPWQSVDGMRPAGRAQVGPGAGDGHSQQHQGQLHRRSWRIEMLRQSAHDGRQP